MTSEIRTNSLKSRAGLSTVTLTDSGPMFSGITTFVDNSGFNIGTGSSIFSPATNTLTFGTNSNERLRINSSGQLITGGTATPYPTRSVTIQPVTGQTNTYLSIVAGNTTSTSGLTFGDTAGSAAGNYAGMFEYYHNGDYLTYKQAGNEKLRITSDKVMFSVDAKVDANNTRDLGANGAKWKTLYLGTQLNIDATSSTEMIVLDAGGTNFARIGHNTSSGTNMLDVRSEGHMRFLTNGNNERLRITSGGYMGVGTDNPTAKLEIKNGGNNYGTSLRLTQSHNSAFSEIASNWGGSMTINAGEGAGTPIIHFQLDNTEKMKLTNEGSGGHQLRLGATSATNIYNSSGTGNEGHWLVAGGYAQMSVSNEIVCIMNRKSSNGQILQFRYNGSSVGSISTNANSLPSDRNFKTNISDLNLGLSFVNKLKPSQFNYKIDEPNTPVMYGLIAQELEESLTSEGVTKNSTQLIQHNPTEESESDYDVDYGKLTPVLINAIKELSTEVKNLKSDIDILKSSINS